MLKQLFLAKTKHNQHIETYELIIVEKNDNYFDMSFDIVTGKETIRSFTPEQIEIIRKLKYNEINKFNKLPIEIL